MPSNLKLMLTRLEAECLLELAQEAEIEALSLRRRQAAERAMHALIRSLSEDRRR